MNIEDETREKELLGLARIIQDLQRSLRIESNFINPEEEDSKYSTGKDDGYSVVLGIIQNNLKIERKSDFETRIDDYRLAEYLRINPYKETDKYSLVIGNGKIILTQPWPEE